jgi:hypothetical protein
MLLSLIDIDTSFLNKWRKREYVISKATKNFHCNTIFLTRFARPLQDTSMKIHTGNTPLGRTPLVLVEVTIGKLSDVMKQMNQTEKDKTGLSKLTDQELATLHDFLDDNVVLAPGGQPH